MYENLLTCNEDLAPLLRGFDPALSNLGTPHRLLRVHEKHVAAQLRGEQIPPVGPRLMKRIADARTVRLAISSLTNHGARAPGPSQTRLEELNDAESWSLARTLSECIRNKTYCPGRVRRVPIPKEGKLGEFRVLTIQSAEDRVVGKATQMILRPLVEPTFSPFSFGFRKEMGRFDALATMLALATRQDRWFAVCCDVEKAFDRIPHARLVDACRQHLPDDVIDFVRLISHTGKKRAIPQGACLSPLLANIFFDHFLDRPHHRRDADHPLIRYADNLLVLCGSREEAQAAQDGLSGLARAAGTPMKASANSICDLRRGERLEWLGFLLRREANRMTLRIGEKAWQHLDWRFAKAHFAENAWLRAQQIALGWIEQMGPCFAFEDRSAVVHRLQAVAKRFAFDEIPGRSTLLNSWSAAHARWHRLRRQQAQVLEHRLFMIQPATEGVRA